MYRYLRGDASEAESEAEKQIDYRLEEYLLQADDTDLIYDMSSLNDRPADHRFDPFCQELQVFLDEKQLYTRGDKLNICICRLQFLLRVLGVILQVDIHQIHQFPQHHGSDSISGHQIHTIEQP